MDACGIRTPGAVLLRKSDLPTEKDYAGDAEVRRKTAAAAGTPATPRRHPSPNAGQRPATPRRHPSPNAVRASAPAAAGSQAKRSQSTEQRPATPSRQASGGSRASTPSRISAPTSPSSAPSSPDSSSSSSSTPVRDAVSETQSAPRRLSGGGRAPDGLWPSMRNLSPSFQLESKAGRIGGSSADQTKTKDASSATDRKRSPLRGRIGGSSADQTKTKDASSATDRKRSPLRGRSATEQSENPHAKVIDHHRWPAMMGGRVSGSAMSRSMDLTDKTSRPALSSIPSRGTSPKRASVSSAANALSRSIDLADKIDRLVSSSVSSRGGSPRSPASNGTTDTPKSMNSGKDAKTAPLAIPPRGISPVRTATAGGTRSLSKSMDLTEKDNCAAVSSPSVSVSSATSKSTRSPEKHNGLVSSPASSRGLSPRTSGGIGAISKNIDFPEKEKRTDSSAARGDSPRRRLASNGVNAIAKNMDFAGEDSRSVISSVPSRGVSPRRRLASDGVDAMLGSTDFPQKDKRPSTSSSSLRGVSPRRRLASDGISAISKGMDFSDKGNMPSTPSAAARSNSPKTQLVSAGAGTTSKGMDLPDRENRPSTSYTASRGMSPRRRLASDGINSISSYINFTGKDTRTVPSSVTPRGISTIRRLASDGAETVSKNMDPPEKDARPTSSSAALRGVSPRSRLASDGVNAISKSMDLSEKDTRTATSSAASRGVSPRRRLASDGVDSISTSSYFVERDTKSSTSAASRGMSPRRRLASDGVSTLLKSTDSAGKDYRPSTSSGALRGASPRSRVASKSINALSRSMDFSDKDCRPSSSSGALRGTPRGVRLTSDGINSLQEGVDTVDKGSARSASSAPSSVILESILDVTYAEGEVIPIVEEVNSLTPYGSSGDISESMSSGNVDTGADMSIASKDRPPSRPVPDSSNDMMSQSVDAFQEDNRPIPVKIPSRGTSPRRRLASDGIDAISKRIDFAEKDKKPITMSIPSRGMAPRRTARSDVANIMSKSMDFSEKCNGPMSSVIPSRVVFTRRILGPDGANAMSRSVDLTDKIRQPISSTVQSCRLSPRKTPLVINRVKGPELLSGDVGRPCSTDGNGSQEENAGSSPGASSNNSEKIAPSKQMARTPSSPSRGLIRPSSPTKASSTSSFAGRRLPSPLRIRPSTPVSPCSSVRSDSASSILSYIGDATRGKKSPSHIEDAHQLRLLYNRNLQWRFTNAYVDEMLSIQKMGAETMLYSVWDNNSRMSESMVMKRSYVQRLRQEFKLGIVLKEQMDYLDHWAALETDHSTSLSGAIEALRASTLRLPVTGGAKADGHTIKNAVSSAVDIMQAMGSSICHLLSKLQAAHSLVTELSAVAAKESTTLNEYRELLATAAALQVHEASLRTQLIQHSEQFNLFND